MSTNLPTLAAAAIGSLAVFTLGAAPVNAATTTSTLGVSGTVEANCVIESAGSLAFGTVGVLTTAVDGSSTISVKCTNTTPYNIGLNAGLNGPSVTNRKMIGASLGNEKLNYVLYSDSARTVNWGNTVGTDTVAATGTGSSVAHTVYGRIPIQAAPKPDGYSDTITVTVTY